MADIIISVTPPPGLSTLIDQDLATSWSESKTYTGVTISALVDSAIVGQTPVADVQRAVVTLFSTRAR
jgi:hypothetical protein